MSLPNVASQHPRRSIPRLSPVWPLLALCCCLSVVRGQWLETTIMLPDTLGPLTGPYHLAWDDSPAHQRLYVGSEQGDIIVADAGNYRRLARIPVSPVYALCYVSRHGKLYGANRYKDSVTVIDGLTNQVIKHIKVPSRPSALIYNHRNDRLYCGGISTAVIDCARDTVVLTIAAPAAAFAFDSSHNKLYAGSSGATRVIDCEQDSIVTLLDRVRGATKMLCYNQTAKKVYAALGDTLFAVHTGSDSVVANLALGGLSPSLTCDPQANRIYCVTAAGARLHAVDCVRDSVIYTKLIAGNWIDITCDAQRNRIIYTTPWAARILDGSTGSDVTAVPVDGDRPGLAYSSRLDRVFSVPDSHSLFAISCEEDSVVGGVPMTVVPRQLILDTVLNKLYFLGGYRRVGAVDCARHVVTSYMWQCDFPSCMASSSDGNKLYCGSANDLSVVVFDATADTVLGTIGVGGRALAMVMHPARNKLYVFANSGMGYWIDVVDCRADTVLRRITLLRGYPLARLLVSENDRLWSLHDYGFTVIDTKYDSIVADTVTSDWPPLEAACAAPEDRRIYRSGRGRLYCIDMDDITHVKCLFRGDEFHYLYYVVQAHKLYWACRNDVGIPDSVYVLDTRSDSVVGKFLGTSQTSGMCSDRTGNYVYSCGSTDAWFFTIDTRTDAVVNRIRIPRNPRGLAYNPRTHRIYCIPEMGQTGGIPVIYDSAGAGLSEAQAILTSRVAHVTIAGRSASLRSTTQAHLFNAAGRVASNLRPGPNDIGHLAPGVYFLRDARAPAQAQAVCKVVIAR